MPQRIRMTERIDWDAKELAKMNNHKKTGYPMNGQPGFFMVIHFYSFLSLPSFFSRL